MSRITDYPKCSGQKRIPINGLAGFDEYFLIDFNDSTLLVLADNDIFPLVSAVLSNMMTISPIP